MIGIVSGAGTDASSWMTVADQTLDVAARVGNVPQKSALGGKLIQTRRIDYQLGIRENGLFDVLQFFSL